MRATRLGTGDLLVAMFHRTLERGLFEAQLDALSEGTTPVSGADVVAALRGGPPLPPAALWITFDDAYADFAHVAWPVLRERALTPTMFVPTGFVGGAREFWWDRLTAAFEETELRQRLRCSDRALDGRSLASRSARVAALRRAKASVKSRPHHEGMQLVDELVELLGPAELPSDVRVLDWVDLRRLKQEGVELAGHTRTHPMLDQVSLDDVEREIVGAMEDLEREVGDVLPAFAYPSGRYNVDVTRVVRDLGIPVAVTTVAGVERVEQLDPLRVRRLPVGPYADGTAVALRRVMAQVPTSRRKRAPHADPPEAAPGALPRDARGPAPVERAD